MKKINFGIIGCGGISRKRTIPGLLLAKNAVCHAIMDTNADFLSAVGEEFGIEKRYTDIDEMLSDKEIDAVYIATPVFCHKEQVYKAARAGKHVLLEKPMGLTDVAFGGENAQKFENNIFGSDPRTELSGKFHTDDFRGGNGEGLTRHCQSHIQTAGTDGNHTDTAAGGGVTVGTDQGLARFTETFKVKLMADTIARR